MIDKRLHEKLEERKQLLAEINAAILAYDPVLREKARDILLAEVFGLNPGGNPANGHEPAHSSVLSSSAKITPLQDLIDRWPPKTQANQALLSAYHLQMMLGYRWVTGRQIQTNLKKLGFRLTNVTVATSENAKSLPPRMKKIRSRGRKGNYYVITHAGISFVENNLNGVGLACATDHG